MYLRSLLVLLIHHEERNPRPQLPAHWPAGPWPSKARVPRVARGKLKQCMPKPKSLTDAINHNYVSPGLIHPVRLDPNPHATRERREERGRERESEDTSTHHCKLRTGCSALLQVPCHVNHGFLVPFRPVPMPSHGSLTFGTHPKGPASS